MQSWLMPYHFVEPLARFKADQVFFGAEQARLGTAGDGLSDAYDGAADRKCPILKHPRVVAGFEIGQSEPGILIRRTQWHSVIGMDSIKDSKVASICQHR